MTLVVSSISANDDWRDSGHHFLFQRTRGFVNVGSRQPSRVYLERQVNTFVDSTQLTLRPELDLS